MVKNSYILAIVLVVIIFICSIMKKNKDQKSGEYYRSCIIGYDESDCWWNKPYVIDSSGVYWGECNPFITSSNCAASSSIYSTYGFVNRCCRKKIKK